MLSINQITVFSQARRKKKRVGRGNSSGHGTYSCRGLKGQKARSGVSGLKKKGLKQVLQRTPKKRGFKSAAAKAKAVNLSAISRLFHDGEIVSLVSLRAKKLISANDTKVKILGQGFLGASKLIFQGLSISRSAQQEIAKKSGQIR